MVSNQKLFSVGDFDFRLQHLLVIGVLILAVSIGMLIRSGPMAYGLDLFEFDPWFNFRATSYIVDNGSDAYFNWVDEKTWHPFGRDVSENSQVTLHLTTAYLYKIFGFGLSLYDFVVLFPLVIGSLTAIIVFAFVRVLAGTTAGLLGALIFSISVPIFTRGLIGWFKSEPLGLFFGFLALYLFVSGIKFNKGKISVIKLILASLFLVLSISAWGGSLLFLAVISLFFISLPFLNKEKNFLIWSVPIFTTSLILFSLLFERTSRFIVTQSEIPGQEFVFTLAIGGLIILIPTIFVIICEIIKKFSPIEKQLRNISIFFGGIIVSTIAIISSNVVGLPAFRYLNAANPFLKSTDALTDSVAEHTTVSLSFNFQMLSVLLIFTLIGIWFVFSKKELFKNEMRAFILITSLIGIYLSSAFIRLELFASLGIIILGSIGISILFKEIYSKKDKIGIKIIFSAVIVALFVCPLALPLDNNWTSWSDFPPSILTGATNTVPSTDWIAALTWLKNNTPEDSVIVSWWDYGYWITTISERATVVDNATVSDFQIKKVAYALTTNPDDAWNILYSDYNTDVSESIGNDRIIKFEGQIEKHFLLDYQSALLFDDSPNVRTSNPDSQTYENLTIEEKQIVDQHIQENGYPKCEPIFKSKAKKLNVSEFTCNPVTKGLDADYVIIYIAGDRVTYNENLNIYVLEGGGDESKKSWIVKISEQKSSQFIQSDSITPTQNFQENTALGKMIPYSIITYVEPNTDRTFDSYQDGLIPIYVQDPKFLNETDPFRLVYASPSFYENEPGQFQAIFIYKINPDYIPKND